MAYETKNNTGSLFKNDRKQSDKHPDYKGSAVVSGQEVWMSAWIKKSRDGQTYMSFAFEPKQEQAKRAAAASQAPDDRWDEPDDDRVPF